MQHISFCLAQRASRRGNSESCTAQKGSKRDKQNSIFVLVYLKELVTEVVAGVILKVAQLKKVIDLIIVCC